MDMEVSIARTQHLIFSQQICDLMAEAAKERGTGIAKRSSQYIEHKIKEGKAVIAIKGDRLAGFCYIESWDTHKYVANSGLIVHPDFRKMGLAKKIKKAIFELSRKKFPEAKIFGITTSLAVMKINSDLGYKPVTFSELTTDEDFWKGCQSCANYDILTRTNKSHCLCTGMLYQENNVKNHQPVTKVSRWEKFKRFLKQDHDTKGAVSFSKVVGKFSGSILKFKLK